MRRKLPYSLQDMPDLTRRDFTRAATTASATFAAAIFSRNARSACRAGSAEGIAGIDDYCRRALSDWRVPGIALAAISDGQLLLARGYGVRDLTNEAPVSEHTVFPIASCTKSFTAALVGRLIDQRRLRWDDSISEHFPTFETPRRNVTADLTMRHALQHRTGLPTANMLWRSGEFDASEILSRVRFLQPVAQPGERFLYNNVMYLAAARAAEHVSGIGWDKSIRSEFFEPLGMKSSVTRSSQLTGCNLATPHATIDDKVESIERYCPDVIAPAGAIHSTAADMAQWLIMHLNGGRRGDKELLTATRVHELHTPVETKAAAASTKDVPSAPMSRYGLGWFVNEHAGRTVVEHSGVQNGFVSWMAIMPTERLGVVILSNHHQTGINYALRHWIFDRLLGQSERDWSKEVRLDHTRGWQRLLRQAKAQFDANPPLGNRPLRRLAEYAGNYESRLYGQIEVSKRFGRLRLQFGKRFQGELKVWGDDTFRAFFPNPGVDDWLVTFSATEGRVSSLRVQESPWAPEWYDDRDDLGVFERR